MKAIAKITSIHPVVGGVMAHLGFEKGTEFLGQDLPVMLTSVGTFKPGDQVRITIEPAAEAPKA